MPKLHIYFVSIYRSCSYSKNHLMNLQVVIAL